MQCPADVFNETSQAPESAAPPSLRLRYTRPSLLDPALLSEPGLGPCRCMPNVAVLYLMNRRLSQFDIETVRQRQAKGERLRDLIGGATMLPAQANGHHDYWVFPMLVNEPRKFIDALRAAGFDAADQTRTQHIPAPQDRPELEPATAERSMRGLIVVPCYETMPDSELARAADVIRKAAVNVPPWEG